MLETLATAVERDVGALMHEVDRLQVGLHIFDFLGNSVLAEVDTQLANAMPGMYTEHTSMTRACTNDPNIAHHLHPTRVISVRMPISLDSCLGGDFDVFLQGPFQ